MNEKLAQTIEAQKGVELAIADLIEDGAPLHGARHDAQMLIKHLESYQHVRNRDKVQRAQPAANPASAPAADPAPASGPLVDSNLGSL